MNNIQLWIPPDWKPMPQLINRIADEKLRKWATQINAQWTRLGRKISEDVQTQTELYSIIPVPHG